MKKQTFDSKPAGPKPWYDPRVRAIFFQVVAIALVFWGGWILIDNTLSNMESRGISTGFGFLDESAGFGIIMSLVPYDATMSYGRTFWVGLTNTLLVSAMGVVTATILGFIIGVARLSSNWLVAKVSLAYIEVIRTSPCCCRFSSGTLRCSAACLHRARAWTSAALFSSTIVACMCRSR